MPKKFFAGNYAPRGWAFCEGQTLSINQNMQLFSVIGTIYGGDGKNTFQLPDLRGRVVVGAGKAPSATQHYRVGQKGGQTTTTIHNEQNNVIAPNPNTPKDDIKTITTASESNVTTDNRQPFLSIRYIICINTNVGIYPGRN